MSCYVSGIGGFQGVGFGSARAGANFDLVDFMLYGSRHHPAFHDAARGGTNPCVAQGVNQSELLNYARGYCTF